MYYGIVLKLPIVKFQSENPAVKKGFGSMTMSVGGWKNRAEARREYKKCFAELPFTRKLLDLGKKGCIYHQVFDIDRGCLLLEARTIKKLFLLSETIKLSLGIADLNFSEEVELIRLTKRPPKRGCSRVNIFTLIHPTEEITKEFFELDIITGRITMDKIIQDLGGIIRKIMLGSHIRKALACFYESQNIFYTHLVGSYMACHSVPDLKHMPKEKYMANNFVFREKMALAFIAAYRGIEAIFKYCFSENDFKPGRHTYRQEINGKIKGIYWDSMYPKTFYRVRQKGSSKKSRVATMIKHFLLLRNKRVGHGLEWPHPTIQVRVTIDMVHEIKVFLNYLLCFALDNSKTNKEN